jgi:hypothetical protein
MHLKCPNCGAAIPAGQINIQQLVAVCPDCDHVFAFSRDAVARKAKRRKLKAPARVHVREDAGELNLSYRLVFGPGPKFGAAMVTIGALAYTAIFIRAGADNAPDGFMIFMGVLALLMYYLLAVFFTTTTRITADDAGIEVKSGPLPFPIKDDKTLSAADISHVAFEKTQETIPPGMPTHNVYAEFHDGERVNVVTSLPREHARYLAATLDDYLRALDGEAYTFEDLPDDDAMFTESGIAADGELDAAILQAAQDTRHREAR